jgi:magnesium transporter
VVDSEQRLVGVLTVDDAMEILEAEEEDTLESAVVLALFIPLLIDTGGNSGAQASTAVIRAMAVGEVRFTDLPRIVWREARVGVLLGLMLAAAVFVPVAVIYEVDLAFVISATLVTICTWATIAGAALPLLAKRLWIDPAVVSAPVITTLVDATGLIISSSSPSPSSGCDPPPTRRASRERTTRFTSRSPVHHLGSTCGS